MREENTPFVGVHYVGSIRLAVAILHKVAGDLDTIQHELPSNDIERSIVAPVIENDRVVGYRVHYYDDARQLVRSVYLPENQLRANSPQGFLPRALE